MTVLYPDLFYIKVCYEGTALYSDLLICNVCKKEIKEMTKFPFF